MSEGRVTEDGVQYYVNVEVKVVKVGLNVDYAGRSGG
jgi:hypothetical protein